MSGFVNLPQISSPKTVILSVDNRSEFGVKYRCINIDVPTRPRSGPSARSCFFRQFRRPTKRRAFAPPAPPRRRKMHLAPPARNRGALFGTPPLYPLFKGLSRAFPKKSGFYHFHRQIRILMGAICLFSTDSKSVAFAKELRSDTLNPSWGFIMDSSTMSVQGRTRFPTSSSQKSPFYWIRHSST